MNPSASSNTKWKLPYLYNLLDQDINCSFPILALTETWLKSYITDAQIHLPGYDIIRDDRSSRKGGGVLLYISDQLHWSPVISKHTTTKSAKQLPALAKPPRRQLSSSIALQVHYPATPKTSSNLSKTTQQQWRMDMTSC
jgi:hypothetical protein